MRCRLILLLFCSLTVGPAVLGAEGRVIKVLAQFVDRKGHFTVSPSLYDRDAYQKYLRIHPEKQGGMRFAVQWKAKVPETEPLKLRVELRGVVEGNKRRATTLEESVRQHHWFSHWTSLMLTGEAYETFGDVTAWRVTLWDGNELLGEQKSFLW
jgi:hypothetical protein